MSDEAKNQTTIRLRAPREDGDHCVALEPAVFAALLQFAEWIKQRIDEHLPEREAGDGG